MSTFNILSSLTESPKVGLSAESMAAVEGENVAGVGGLQYLEDGEKSFTTSGHTRSVSSWLKSFSYRVIHQWEEKRPH